MIAMYAVVWQQPSPSWSGESGLALDIFFLFDARLMWVDYESQWAMSQSAAGDLPAAVRELVKRVVPSLVARMREADVAWLVAPAVVIASSGWLELRWLLVVIIMTWY